jgi:hypothetical protein
MSSVLETRIRALVDSGDPDGTVTVRWLAGILDGTEPEGGELEDLDVKEMAKLAKRARSTIRTWLGQGEGIPGAYRLRGREWRVPRLAFRRFLDSQGETGTPSRTARRPDLGSWRKYARDPKVRSRRG